MRWIGWILVVVLLVGWIATDLPPVVSPTESLAPDLWRRTLDGWERAEWLLPEAAPASLWLHPAVLATFQIVVSITGFTVFCRRLHEPEPSSASVEAFQGGGLPNNRQTIGRPHARSQYLARRPRGAGIAD